MEKFNYYFSTQDRVNAALNEPITKANMNSILFNLVWYAYYNVSDKEDAIISYVSNWLKDKTNIFHLASYAKTLRGYIKKMKKMPWRNISDTVKIRKSELEYISSFEDIKKEKILFCYLAIAKFKDMSRPSPSHWEDEEDITVFKMAKVPIPAKDRDYFINDLIHGDNPAMIHENYQNDNTSKRIDYISDDINDPVVLELDESNYYELAFTYLNWKEKGGYKKCKKCGRLFRISKSIGKDIPKNNGRGSSAQYCRACSPSYDCKYKGQDEFSLDYEPKKIVCSDCGKEFCPENYMAGHIYRCNSCQEAYRKTYMRDLMREKRQEN